MWFLRLVDAVRWSSNHRPLTVYLAPAPHNVALIIVMMMNMRTIIYYCNQCHIFLMSSGKPENSHEKSTSNPLTVYLAPAPHNVCLVIAMMNPMIIIHQFNQCMISKLEKSLPIHIQPYGL